MRPYTLPLIAGGRLLLPKALLANNRRIDCGLAPAGACAVHPVAALGNCLASEDRCSTRPIKRGSSSCIDHWVCMPPVMRTRVTSQSPSTPLPGARSPPLAFATPIQPARAMTTPSTLCRWRRVVASGCSRPHIACACAGLIGLGSVRIVNSDALRYSEWVAVPPAQSACRYF